MLIIAQTGISEYLPSIGGFAVMVSLITLLARTVRSDRNDNASLRKEQDERIEGLKTDIKTEQGKSTRCERRLSIVIRALQEQGLQVPPEIWEEK
jgi:septal ring factor EnvC (AmiA/AmiB activator)